MIARQAGTPVQARSGHEAPDQRRPAQKEKQMLHAHMTGSSRDCDGDYSRGEVYEMTTEEKADRNPDFAFKDRVLAHTVSLHGTGTLEVSPTGIHWYEQTDEGYRRADVEWCEDACPDTRSWQRDHRAEEMGY